MQNNTLSQAQIYRLRKLLCEYEADERARATSSGSDYWNAYHNGVANGLLIAAARLDLANKETA